MRTKSETLFDSPRGADLPDAARALYLEAERLHAGGSFEEAIPRIERFLEAVAGRPAASTGFSNLADCLLRLERRDGAFAAAERAVEIDSSNWIARVTRGECLQSMERLEEALADFREAAERLPDGTWARDLLGNCLEALKRHEEAVAAYDSWLEVLPNDDGFGRAYVHLRKSRALRRLERLDEAVASLDRSIECFPDAYHAWANRGGLHYQADRFEMALADFDRWVGLEPDMADAYYWRAYARWALRDREAALFDLERACTLDSASAHNLLAKGTVEDELDQEDAARSSLEAALRLNPAGEVRIQVEAALRRLGPALPALEAEETRIASWQDTARGDAWISPDLSRWARRTGGTIVVDGVERGTFRDAGPVRWREDGSDFAFAARRRRRWRVVTEHGEGAEFERVDPASVVWAPGGRLVYAARDRKDWRWFLGSVERGGFVGVAPTSVAFDPRGNGIAAVAFRKRPVWREAWVVMTETVHGPYDEANGLVFSRNGAHFAFVAEREGRRFIVADGIEGASFDAVKQLQFVGDSDRIAFLARRDDRAFVVRDGEEGPPFEEVSDLVISEDGERFAHTASRGEDWLLIRDGAEERVELEEVPLRIDIFPIRIVAMSPDGSRLATVRSRPPFDCRLVVDDWRSPRFSDIDFESVAFSPDSRHLAFVAKGRSWRNRLLVVGVGCARLGSGILARTPRWTPDGRAVAVRWNEEGLFRTTVRT